MINTPLQRSAVEPARRETPHTPVVESQTGRLLFVTMDFPPARAIGAHACEQIARHLTLYGWEPVVLTIPRDAIENADPQYRRGFPGKVVTAKPLPHPIHWYRKLKTVVRQSSDSAPSVAQQPRQNEGRLRTWVLSLLAAPDIYTGWILPAVAAGLKTIRRERITHIFSSAPFWSNHIIGLMLAKLTGLPWVAHYRDPWNQVPQAKAVSPISAHIERWLERLVIRRADVVICVTERHTALLRQTYADLAAEKFVTIPNGYDEAEWDGSEGVAVEPERTDAQRFTITYTGGFRLGTRTPRPIFRAVRELIDAGELTPDDVLIEMYGDCEEAEGIRVADISAQYGLETVAHVLPPLSRPQALRRMAGSDLLLLLAEGWTLQIPGKTYEYFRAGRPILALTSDGALADLLRVTNGAWVCEPSDGDAITAAVRDAYTMWKSGQPPRTADPAVVASFDRRRLAGRYAALIAGVRKTSHVRN